MANKRLLSRAVIEDDDFIELSRNARLFYMYINTNCDDEGFCGSPKSIGRLADFNSKEIPELLKELTDSGFLIKFDNSNVVVETDWYRNNNINSNRWSETEYLKQRGQLIVDDNRRYQLAPEGQGLDIPFFRLIGSKKKNKSSSVNHEVENVISYMVSLVSNPYKNPEDALQDQNIVLPVQNLLKEHSAAEIKEYAKWAKHNRLPRTLSQLISSTQDAWTLPR